MRRQRVRLEALRDGERGECAAFHEAAGPMEGSTWLLLQRSGGSLVVRLFFCGGSWIRCLINGPLQPGSATQPVIFPLLGG